MMNISIVDSLYAGDSNVKVVSTTGIYAGDKVEITDETFKKEINYVSNILGNNIIVLENEILNKYSKVNNPLLKVLRDSFTNNHVHKIKKCQMETLNIIDYLPYGYNNYHSHSPLPALNTVLKIIEKDENISAIGSSSKIFSTDDIYSNWECIKDLNSSLENNDKILSITDIILKDNKYVVGTENGYIATESSSKEIIPLEKPII
jgi:hypothetical protein